MKYKSILLTLLFSISIVCNKNKPTYESFEKINAFNGSEKWNALKDILIQGREFWSPASPSSALQFTADGKISLIGVDNKPSTAGRWQIRNNLEISNFEIWDGSKWSDSTILNSFFIECFDNGKKGSCQIIFSREKEFIMPQVRSDLSSPQYFLLTMELSPLLAGGN